MLQSDNIDLIYRRHPGDASHIIIMSCYEHHEAAQILDILS